MSRRVRTTILAAFSCLLLCVALAAQANLGGAPGNGDMACLRSMADACFAALVAHDTSKAGLASGARFTENAQAVSIGDGSPTN